MFQEKKIREAPTSIYLSIDRRNKKQTTHGLTQNRLRTNLLSSLSPTCNDAALCCLKHLSKPAGNKHAGSGAAVYQGWQGWGLNFFGSILMVIKPSKKQKDTCPCKPLLESICISFASKPTHASNEPNCLPFEGLECILRCDEDQPAKIEVDMIEFYPGPKSTLLKNLAKPCGHTNPCPAVQKKPQESKLLVSRRSRFVGGGSS